MERCARGRGHMRREALCDGVAAERLTRPRWKDRRVWYAGALGEPRPQGCGYRFGERRDSLLAPFPETVDVRTAGEVQVHAPQAGEF